MRMIHNLMTLLFLLFFAINSWGQVNHAPLDSRHIQVAENFIQRNFKTDQYYDARKIEEFIQRLYKDYQAFQSDAYANAIIDSVDIRLEELQTARANALEEIQEGKNDLLNVYNKHIIPMAKEIHRLVQQGADQQLIDGKVDKFIEYYHIFYTPELPRNRWRYDINMISKVPVIFGHKRYKNVEELEANNLIPGELTAEISRCLNYPVEANVPLEQRQLEQIKKCGIDLSLLEPASNPFIRNLSEEEKQRAKTHMLDLLPKDGEEVKFEFFIYSGLGSPKFVASYYRTINGVRKKLTIKVKTGNETHTDPAASMMGKMLGLHQDHGRHYSQMKFNLGKMPVDEFITRYRRKYRGGLKEPAAFLVGRSPRGSTENWITLRSVAVEIRDPQKSYLSPYDPWGWDLPNRREHRAIMLWMGFLSVYDTKTGNHSVNIRQDKDGAHLEYSPQDMGMSLGGSVDLRFPLSSPFAREGKTVNTFRSTFLSWDSNHVKVHWSDLGISRIRYTTTTYNDLKWMARKIAKLTMEDLDYALSIGGYPEPIKDIYKIKLGMRRNEIIKAFELQNEFELWQLPDLKTYSPNRFIRNGRIVVDGFDNGVHYQAETNSSIAAWEIYQILASTFPYETVIQGFKLRISKALEIGTEQAIADLSKNALGKAFGFDAFNANVRFNVQRRIMLNTVRYAQGPGKMGRYIVKDTVTMGLSLDAEKALKFIPNLPLTLAPKATLWERSFEHVQVANDWKEAVKAAPKIFSYIFHSPLVITQDLDVGDVFKIQDRMGFGLDASMGLTLQSFPFMVFDAKAGMGYSYSRPIYLHRDEMGDVMAFREDRKTMSLSTGLDMFGIDVPILDDMPLLGVSYTYERIRLQSELFHFEVGNPGLDPVSRLYRQREMQSFFEGGNPAYYLKNRVLDLKARGHISRLRWDFLLFFHARKDNSYFKISVENNGVKRNFYRYAIATDNYVGEEVLASHIPTNSWIFMVSRDQWKNSIELEESNVKTATAIMAYQNFRMKLNKPGLQQFIKQLNGKFSKDNQTPIFRDDHLPPESEIKNYFKVMSNMRVHVGIGNFIANIDRVSFNQLSQRIRSKSAELGLRLPKVFLYILDRGIAEIKSHRNRPDKQVKAVASILRYIQKQDHHIRLLKEVMGEENIFVFGEILGIYPSYSLTQELEGVSSRTFGATPWGQLSGISPMRQYLKQNMVAPIYLHMLTDDITATIFGDLPATSGPSLL